MKNTGKLQSTILASALVSSALVLSTVSTPVFAASFTEEASQSSYVDAFKALDINNSDTLTKTEVKSEKLFYKNFSAADKNHNRTLDQQEYTDYKTQVEQKNVKRITRDSLITSKVKAKLLGDEGLKSLNVSVETSHGVVLLSGFVTSAEQIRQAEEIAASTEGVRSVKNSLMLKKD